MLNSIQHPWCFQAAQPRVEKSTLEAQLSLLKQVQGDERLG